MRCLISDDLPMPASPETSTVLPLPWRARSIASDASRSGASRSSSPILYAPASSSFTSCPIASAPPPLRTNSRTRPCGSKMNEPAVWSIV